MTDSELIAEIAKTAITPYMGELSSGYTYWDADDAYNAWVTVYNLFVEHRPEFIKEEMTDKVMQIRSKIIPQLESLSDNLLDHKVEGLYVRKLDMITEELICILNQEDN